jgi:hypothetical protein
MLPEQTQLNARRTPSGLEPPGTEASVIKKSRQILFRFRNRSMLYVSGTEHNLSSCLQITGYDGSYR